MHSKLMPCSTAQKPWPTAAQLNVLCAPHNLSETADAIRVDDQVPATTCAYFEWEIWPAT